jgi:phage terminase large subunit
MQENRPEVNILKACMSMFKKGLFDFITVREGKKHKKQEEALEFLIDGDTEELLYGGAAGGAKSWTGCVWLLFMCLLFPNTKWFIGREELKRITKSTLITFFKVAEAYFAKGAFRFNAQSNTLIFKNGSTIDFLELKYQPRDPLYERFGSLEYTGGWIEEGGEINYGAYEVLKTRIGRHLNDKYNIKAKIFITCNPKKNWIYTEFYKLFKAGGLRSGLKRFLQAFVQDNPFIESGYIDRLKRTKDKSKRERLLNGNWEYDDNPYSLCDYENILATFENDHINRNHLGEKISGLLKYITCDVARFGSDKARIGVWEGWDLIEVVTFDLSATTEIQAAIDALRVKHKIPKHRCVADEDGVGGGVVDSCGIKGFINNAKPFLEKVTDSFDEVPAYENLQTQCLFKLAEKIQEASVNISADLSPADKEMICEELSSIERNPSVTNKLALTKKAYIKENIGRSPDYRDLMLMRVFFEYDEAGKVGFKFVR